ncbi:MAG: hypothetical protein KDK96_10075 [Chlamydiia bacterium]|nr:hypothetical protein [Chlamydiia bacterium]
METFAKFYSQPLFFSGQPKKILFLEIIQSLGASERASKQYTKRDLESDSTTKALAQINSSKQGSLKFQRLTNQTGASRWQ